MEEDPGKKKKVEALEQAISEEVGNVKGSAIQQHTTAQEPISQEKVLPGYLSEEEEIPDHFYDSDLASINEKDFLSDNQPPKDIIEERKLLKKEKMLHIFKTIVRLGYQIDKPARFDRVRLKCKEVPQPDVKPRPLNLSKKKKEADREKEENKDEKQQNEESGGKEEKEKEQQQEELGQPETKISQEVKLTDPGSKKAEEQAQRECELRQIEAYQQSHKAYEYPPYFSSSYLAESPQMSYNLGKEHLDIEQLVTSMKRGEAAVFELEHLEVSAKSGIKRRIKVEVFVIWLQEWTTVIDVDCDGKFMKEVVKRGEGHSRVALHDEVAFTYSIKRGQLLVEERLYSEPARVEPQFLEAKPNIFWKMMHSMKAKEAVRVEISNNVMKEVEEGKFQRLLKEEQEMRSKVGCETEQDEKWVLQIEVFWFHSLDDIFLDGRLLKKILTRGVSTARPDASSLVYYALQFHSPSGELLYSDPCFYSDWWEDLSKLEELKCRKSHLDDESLSEMLVKTIDRMKPAEVSMVECRDPSLFAFGTDYEEYMKLTGAETVPDLVKLSVRIYNFSEGKNCFNMEIHEKVEEARRKKKIALNYLSRGEIQQALSTFETIVSFFSSGKIDQAGYDEKVSALMNSCFCHLKLENFREVIKLSELILESPKHGYDPQKLKVKGPGQAKIEGKLPEEPDDERQSAELAQNDKTLDKCRWRKALCLVRMGEGQQALDCLGQIKVRDNDVLMLQTEALKMKDQYQKKSAKMFKNMFG